MLLLNNMIPHRSLNNLSKDIRWSLDLRWQRPDKSCGFYDIKEGVLMRTKDDPDLKIDWDKFGQWRHFADKMQSDKAELDEEEFDTTIQGPWMKKWELVHTNRHTAKLRDDQFTWHKN